MSHNRLEFSGLAELKRDLKNLPSELAREARTVVSQTATKAAGEIVSAYPTRTGNLKRGVKVSDESSGFSAVATVKNTAKHAYIFENGTQARHTDIGANRGAMPPGNVFIPIVVRRRRGMYHELAEIVRKHGLVVTGSAG